MALPPIFLLLRALQFPPARQKEMKSQIATILHWAAITPVGTVARPHGNGGRRDNIRRKYDIRRIVSMITQSRADCRREYDIPGPPTDIRQPAAFHTNIDAVHTVGKEGEILQFAVTPNRDARRYVGLDDAPLKQTSRATLAGA